MKNKLFKPTVTIGVCAFNEEKNISNVLEDILKQQIVNCKLSKIIILDDCSNDSTKKIVKNFAKSNLKIKLLSFRSRRGKANRLNYLYKICSTDLIITFDADVRLKNELVVKNIVSKFLSTKAGLINGNVLPKPPKTFFEKIVVTYEYFWRDITMQINNGNNVFNSLGCLVALSKSFYQGLVIPEKIVAEDHYIYLKAKSSKVKTVFAKEAVVFYGAPQTLKDYLKQFARYFSSHDKIENYFGESINENYLISVRIKILTYIKWLLKDPFWISLAILLQFYQRLSLITIKRSDSSTWSVINSSK